MHFWSLLALHPPQIPSRFKHPWHLGEGGLGCRSETREVEEKKKDILTTTETKYDFFASVGHVVDLAIDDAMGSLIVDEHSRWASTLEECVYEGVLLSEFILWMVT